MAMWLRELREQLLRAGVAPRHVRRYVTELHEHWLDLVAEEERGGRTRAEAEGLARSRLGRVEDLARAMTERPELRSWTARAPWLVLGAGPALALAAGWATALLILWTGWNWFLPGSPTPFVRLHGFEIAYFGVGRMLYFSAPVLAGWGMIVVARRQRVRAVGPVIPGCLVVALMGATGTVHVHPAMFAGERADVGIQFFPLTARLPEAAAHAVLLLVLVMLPHVVGHWRAFCTQG